MSITRYRVLSRSAGEPACVLVELSFDGEGYCYGLGDQGERLWRETDTWSINVPEGRDEDEVIHEHIVSWEAESRLPHPQEPDIAPTRISEGHKALALVRLQDARDEQLTAEG